MSVETATELFSYICGQSRTFVADGVLLPVGQRCLGLYVGALVTALWLLCSGIWRRGLPSWDVIFVNVAVLIAAMLGGLHVIDPGPLWRFTCGLWTGHVATLWLMGAAVHFWSLSSLATRSPLPWRTMEKVQGMVFPVALAGLAVSFPMLLFLGWNFWTATAVLGVAVLAITMLLAVFAITYYCSRIWHVI